MSWLLIAACHLRSSARTVAAVDQLLSERSKVGRDARGPFWGVAGMRRKTGVRGLAAGLASSAAVFRRVLAARTGSKRCRADDFVVAAFADGAATGCVTASGVATALGCDAGDAAGVSAGFADGAGASLGIGEAEADGAGELRRNGAAASCARREEKEESASAIVENVVVIFLTVMAGGALAAS